MNQIEPVSEIRLSFNSVLHKEK